MSATHPPTVFDLHSEIFWHIFNFNADMDSKSEESIPAIDTLRHTSQVCSRWRHLILGAPSLWARVLNIGSSSMMKEGEWRVEAIRRTGTSSKLHIKSAHMHTSMESFIKSLLNMHWTRIRSLEIELYRHCCSDSRAEFEKWNVFQRPAPFLETFKISGSFGYIPGFLVTPQFPLFANNAPSLHTLSLFGIAKIEIAAFASTLHHLNLFSPSIQAFELLYTVALNASPSLESLELEDSGNSPPVCRKGKTAALHADVTFPRLKQITLCPSREVDTTLSLLAHIIPREGCVLKFWSQEPVISDAEFVDAIAAIPTVLPKYLRYCTELTVVDNIFMTLTENCIDFASHLPSGGFFRFGMRHTTNLPENAISTFLSCFATLEFKKIKSLVLDLPLPPFEPHPSHPAIKKFIFDLINVETLITDVQTLRFFVMFQQRTGVVALPSLTNIRVKENDANFIKDFLESRLALGMPVNTLTVGV